MKTQEKNNKCYILAPAQLVTGGPEFCQQVCRGLRDNGVDAQIFYDSSTSFPQAESYSARYNNPYTQTITEKTGSIIVPEIYVKTLFQPKYRDFKKFILWASVNFYLSTTSPEYLNVFPPNTFHLLPTKYAEEYLEFAHVPKENIITVPDYISQEFLDLKTKEKEFEKNKENIITFYIPKSNSFTSVVLDQLLKEEKDYEIIPLKGYTTEELIKILSRSKIFLDFSYFPGNNRMHREASCCGNIIFTSQEGAARNKIDVNIPDKYKFEISEENVEKVKNEIKDCMKNYSTRIRDFDEHREEAFQEKEVFDKNIKKLANSIKGIE